jgi:hypothetical protein
LAPFTCFLEHDVPRQRLFQAALAAYGREAWYQSHQQL